MIKETVNANDVQTGGQKGNIFYKHRTISECISDGISIVTNNLFKYFLYTFAPIFLFAVLISVFLYWFICLNSNIIIDFSLTPTFIIFSTIISLLLITIISYFNAVAYTFVKYIGVNSVRQRFKLVHLHALKKIASISCVRIVLICVLGLIITGLCYISTFEFEEDSLVYEIGKIVVVVLLALISLFFYIPTTTINPSLIFGGDSVANNILSGYRMGVFAWRKTFMTFILLLIIKIVLGGLVLTPLISYSFAYKSYLISCLNGDGVTLPASFTISFIAVCLVTVITMIYFMSTLNMTYIYSYASISFDEEEKHTHTIPII